MLFLYHLAEVLAQHKGADVPRQQVLGHLRAAVHGAGAQREAGALLGGDGNSRRHRQERRQQQKCRGGNLAVLVVVVLSSHVLQGRVGQPREL